MRAENFVSIDKSLQSLCDLAQQLIRQSEENSTLSIFLVL